MCIKIKIARRMASVYESVAAVGCSTVENN